MLGLANLIIAWAFDARVRIWFVAVGAVGAKVLSALAQFLLFRYLVRRRLKYGAA